MNISLIGSFFIGRLTQGTASIETSKEENNLETIRDAAFFIKQLNLSAPQAQSTRIIHRNYNRTANRIAADLSALRIQLVDELGSSNSDLERISQINAEFGQLHTELKNETVTYYLSLKALCDSNRQIQLYQIFSEMVANERAGNNRSGGRYGRGWQNQRDEIENFNIR